MVITELVLFAAFVLLAWGLRVAIQLRRTGDHGLRPPLDVRAQAHGWTALLIATGIPTVGVAAPVAALAGLDPPALLHHPEIQGAGLALACIGIPATFAAQLAMGASWRIGVDAGERTALVTTGVFGLVRNPIYTAAITTLAGLALIVPNAVALAGLLAAVAGFYLHVRLVEEPYLDRMHGAAYRGYAARVGRFLPRLGRHAPGAEPAQGGGGPDR
jgi:protein-S-isoprenylcysteine O-methyltransferase Ste14